MSLFAETSFIAQRHGRRMQTLVLLGWLVLHGLSAAVSAADAPQGLAAGTKDYFTHQPADTPLVIRMDAFETEFESRVFDPKNKLLRASGLNTQRLGAVYQFLEASDKPRDLRIEVTLGHGTGRSKLDMQVIRFEPDGPDKSALIRAYRLLSAGLELATPNRADAWTMKVVALMQAALSFEQLGMQELQLWSAIYAHQYLLTVLNDPLTAAEGAREIYTAATRSRLSGLALAALQLQGSAVAQMAARDKARAEDLFALAQSLFQQAEALAAEMDFQHERASAVYQSGLAFERAGDNRNAFIQFDQAVGIASNCGDTALANQIRQHAAELHESLGDNTEAIALLQQISAETPVEKLDAAAAPEETDSRTGEESAGREMVSYLLEQGRLLEKTYRHQQAAEVLRQALELNQKSDTPTLTGPVALSLAKSLYGAGQMETALEYLQEGLKKTPSYRHEEALFEAYGILAAIQRGKGDFTAMSAARERQQMFLASNPWPAGFSLERALDDLATGGTGSAAARALLQQSVKEAKDSGTPTIQHLAELQLCALGASCKAETAQQSLNAVQATGLPAPGLQARFLWSQMLRREGQSKRALAELEGLIEDMRFFQSRLPGVLGAWYWQNRENVFSALMELKLEQNSDAIGSLASLDRLMRDSRQQAVPAPVERDPELERLRSLIAAREAAESGPDASALSSDILNGLQKNRQKMPGQDENVVDLSGRLKQLNENEALLTYYFTPDRVYAWVGRNSGLELVQVPWSPDQAAALARVSAVLRRAAASGLPGDFDGMMDRLGQRLLAPFAEALPPVIYFFPTGRMEGFPLDALRWKGNFLAAGHRVINLSSLAGPGTGDPVVSSRDLQRFFLAGNRQEGAGDFDLLKPPSAELTKIADLFVGPGLHIVQGSALQWDEFQDERITLAGVLHLAMPGIIDLRNPRRSQLLLSDNAADPAHAMLRPQDIGTKNLSAALVVLSACDFDGTNPSAFDQNSRFIPEFLHAGAGSVITSLWNVGDLQAAGFMQRFYRQLMVDPNVGDALAATKKDDLGGKQKAPGAAWAAFQLFVK